MNERIKELALLSGQNLIPFMDPRVKDMIFERFAELIVAECLAVCAVNTDDEPLDYKRGVIFVMNRCQQNIKEHFGVAE